MKITRRLSAALGVAAIAGGLLSAVAVPAAQAAPAAAPAAAARPAMGMMYLQAGLAGGYHAVGHAGYRSGMGYRHLDVQVWNLRRLAGSRLVVYVHGARAGTMIVSRSGYAHLYLARGVMPCQAGQPVRVRTLKGALVASGAFHRT